ncbi:MAG: beta-N-acetylhexosaminidase [Armatimonadetes bacterium]|nr:beta-N-acetylhexosaminidase [Armatimonadota bacterium]
MSRYLCIAILLFVYSPATFAQPKAALKLIPAPREVKVRSRAFVFSRDVSLVLGDATREDDRFAAMQLSEETQRELKLELSIGKRAKKPIFLGLATDGLIKRELRKRKITVDAQLGNEGYVLSVAPGSLLIAANSTAGVFYGVQTLKQLIRANRTGNSIPCVRIRDWPGLRYRGYSDDISRGPIPTMDFFKREIRTMAEFKMNMLTFYTEHVFKLKKYPFIAPEDGITEEEVKELSDYAKPFHVELVGNFQSFGHFYNILKHDEVKDLRETMGIITPAREASYEFLSYIYSEIAPAYNSPLFNVNCDETYGLGEGPSKEEAEKIGVGGVYVKHMVRLHDILKGYGKRMMMWGDIALQHPTIVQQLPKDTILLSWGYGAAEKYDGAIEPFTKAGFDFMVCPGVSCWSQIFPNYENAVVNMQNYIRDGAKFGALGVLNTTWDDDGENLFSWNFYGTNWGAACSWRPEDSGIKDYDAAFSQVSYGTKSDAVAEAIKLLSTTVNIGLTRGLMDPAFWEPPFGALTTTIRATTEQSGKLQSVTEEVAKLLTQAKRESTLDALDLDYLLFANRRLRFLADSRLARVAAAQECSKAFEAYLGGVGNDTSAGRKAMQRALDSFGKLSSELSGIRSEYERLWRLENRPSSLDNILKRYDSLLKQFSDEEQLLRKAVEDLDKTATLPDPRSIGLEVVETTARNTKALPSRSPILPANAPWWNEAWSYRLPIRIDTGDLSRVDCPVELHVNLSGLPKPLDPRSVRLVECKPTGEIVGEVPCQFDPDKEGAAGNIVFMLRGTTPAKISKSYALYFDAQGGTETPPVTEKGIAASDKAEGVWVENDHYRILLGKEGAHLYVWQVKSLDNKDVTEPGERDWAGFSDYGTNDRTAEFELTQEAKGPVMVRYRCKSKLTGKEKVFNFFTGTSWVEVMLDPPVSFYWDYDRIESFAADSPTPGTAIFSNGHTEPVCKSTEQTHAVGHGTTWCAKTRADGFVLANLTPEVAATHMTGPGGGWGGVGIEWGAPAAHFITFADKTDQKPADLLNALQRTLDFRNQVRMYVGKVEERRQGNP